ncbi:MAG: zinc metallopeptidase [Christensenellaceae bacterium]|nr:zinc metallopeptidase [Christensenellaceae bacterium]
MFLEYYIMGIILLPAIIFAIWAQSKVHSTYSRYSQVTSRRGTTAAELLEHLKRVCYLENITIKKVKGHLTDHYNSHTKELALSDGVYNSSSVAALGIACHEFGHALQDKDGYIPLKLRQIIIPVSNFASTLLMPLVIIGLIFGFAVEGGGLLGEIFLWSGVVLFGSATLANLVTLPVEYNASNRAIKVLRDSVTLEEDELVMAKKVLNAAALTYVAALLISLLNLVRFLLIVLAHRR